MKQLSRWFAAALVAWLSLLSVSALAQPATCSAPGKDGVTFSQPSYYPGAASVAAGQTTISVGAIRGAGDANLPANSGAPGTTPLSAGDLVMVIQMQDASYNNSNNTTTVAFGDGSTGRGFTNRNNSGGYEFRRVVSFSGAAVVVDQGLSNSYTRAAPSTGNGTLENGNRRFQVIRVPQFSTLTLPANQSPPAWNGETGGVWVIDVAGNLNMGGFTVDASGLGFRGAGGWPNSYPPAQRFTDYVNTTAYDFNLPAGLSACAEVALAAALNIGASKGEGIAGTPQLVRNQSTAANTAASFYADVYSFQDLGLAGYANNGIAGRGAPGNAGGGGTQHNAGGGGGSNVGQGGLGGNTFSLYRTTDTGGCVLLAPAFYGCGGDGARAMGGLGGGTLPATVSFVIMGGGGGAGDNNNACDNRDFKQAAGGNGGGIIFIRAGSINGGGTLRSNGQNALPGGRDAAGGGGAGGSIVVLTGTANTGLTLSANGGEGGNTAYSGTGGVAGSFLRAGETQGPGAGGGGGAVVFSTGATFAAVAFAGGASGRVFPVNGDTSISNAYGAGAGGGTAATVPFVPTSQSFANNCLPQLQVNKLTTTPLVAFPDRNTAQYIISIANTGPGTAVGATLSDLLPVPFQYAAATAPDNVVGLTYSGTAQGPANPTVGTGSTTLVVGTPGSNTTTTSFLLPPSTTVTFTVTVIVNGGGATPTLNFSFQNSATVGYLDPFRTAAATQVSPGGAYTGTPTAVLGSNYAATSSTQEDVRVLGSVNIALTKTNSVTTLVAGQTTAYTVTVANTGSFPATSVTLADPAAAGLSCTAVTCQAFGTAVCPTVANTTIALLQSAGVVIPSLPVATGSPLNNRMVFTVTCGVTATGQ
jgi:uncharacterized repeat protein (TIGR01451 family)